MIAIDKESDIPPYLNRVMQALEKRWKVNQDNGKKGRSERQTNVAENADIKKKRRWKKTVGKQNEKPNDKPKLTKETKRELKRIKENYYCCCIQQQ